MSWQPIIKEEERLRGKVIVRQYGSSVGLYVPVSTRKMLKIGFNCHCIVNQWQSKTESDNKHKLFIQFMEKEREHSRRLYRGKVNLPIKMMRKYLSEVNDSYRRIEIPIITDNGGILLDLRDLKDGKGDNDEK